MNVQVIVVSTSRRLGVLHSGVRSFVLCPPVHDTPWHVLFPYHVVHRSLFVVCEGLRCLCRLVHRVANVPSAESGVEGSPIECWLPPRSCSGTNARHRGFGARTGNCYVG